MTRTVAQLWRHPIKSHGREALDAVSLSIGKCIPWDRHWAVTHEATKFDGTGWAPCQNFMLGTRTPALAGIWAKLDEATATITLRHADLGSMTIVPDNPEDAERFLSWVAPLCPEGRARPEAIVSLGDRGMTDTDFPSISIMNIASHNAVSAQLGQDISTERWRGNIWLDGASPWQEFDWIGKTIRVGSAEILVRERIVRCLHTAANPVTGQRDADTLGTLKKGWGHTDFGVYGEVVKGGEIRLEDRAEIL